jgi:alpha-galactosidase
MRAPKIVIVGAGGYVFPLRLSVDILSFPELQATQLVLYDIQAESLKRVKRIVGDNKLPAKVTMTTNRRAALKGADYVIVAFQVGGVAAYKFDVEIPRKYGLDQCVGDTLGPGGVFRGLRSIGALRGIAQDMRELCPDALMLQYANPMAMNCWATSSLGVKTVGLCHSVQGTSKMLVQRAGFEYEDVSFKVGGINHQAWFTKFAHADGTDIYPKIRETMLSQNPSPLETAAAPTTKPAKHVQTGAEHSADDDVYHYERVRTEIMRTFGFFHTESSHHGSEYTPWFRKNAKTVKAYIKTRWDYYVISSGRDTPEQQRELENMINGGLRRSEEYGSLIIHSMETDQKRVIYGNVPNDGMPGAKGANAISNLPANACVEVACLVDRNGIQPTLHGALPPQCAAINRTNINVQELAVLGALTGDRDAVHQAIAMDPLTGVLLTLPQIRSMVNEMFAAQAAWLPQFQAAAFAFTDRHSRIQPSP